MTYEQAVAYLDALTNYERHHDSEAMRAVRLERMQDLCRLLGDPQRRFRSVLIAGTNGKGSIAAMLYSMLRQSSLRVGLYTSPHLEDLCERIRVWERPALSAAVSVRPVFGNDWISEQDFASMMEEIRTAVETMSSRSTENRPTYFEVLTACAFLYFSRRQVSVAVLEVGMGGRLDATNVVEQAISLIGPIDVDHADVLGTDRVTIAQQKAGIIKPNQTVITSPQDESVLQVLRHSCESHGVALFVCGKDLNVEIENHSPQGLEVAILGIRGLYPGIHIPLIGRHQAQNAAVAVAALEGLSSLGIPHSMVERGLATVYWPGRLEQVHHRPLVLMDGAHNSHAARALGKTLTELWKGRRIHLLLGLSSDKTVNAIGELLGRLAVSVTCTQSDHPRAMAATVLAEHLTPFCQDVSVMANPIDAYTYLLNALEPTDMIVVTGSLFLIGQLRASLRHAQNISPWVAATDTGAERSSMHNTPVFP